MKENTIKLHQNQPNLVKIAREGREKIWERKYVRFLKTKKTLGLIVSFQREAQLLE